MNSSYNSCFPQHCNSRFLRDYKNITSISSDHILHHFHNFPPMENSCTRLPHPIIYFVNKVETVKSDLMNMLITSPLPSIDEFQKRLNSLHFQQQDQACFELILDIIKVYAREAIISSDDIQRINLLIQIAPNAASLKDESGCLLIHHLAMMESPNKELLSKLLELNPKSVSEYALFGYIEATPFHLVLLKNDPDYELAFQLLDTDPQAARCETVDSKLPIHLLIAAGTSPHPVTEQWRLKVVERLLLNYPQCAFAEIVEEVHFLKLLTEEEVTEGRNSSSSSHYHHDDQDDEDELAGVRILIGGEQYKMETEIQNWSPMKRVQCSSESELKFIFERSLQHFTNNYLSKQWKRK